MEPMNREQRRREKFGKAGKVHQHNPLGPWPDSEANPALKSVVTDQATPAAVPDEDVTDEAASAPAADAPATKAAPRKKASSAPKTTKG